uniref:AlNc14C379G11203 protein n=1 Tax=Albugo laibachii Nc14 TaxID=890382 RepID=F0WYE3_9STRA|nr:AlNc14C379G11203 [Albugo laibachii Nc14]|eukprot:CCA26496.1 AlNc14C379G11203 [Albugo laibachii Nc14]
MSGLTSANPAAGAYLNAIPHHKWALYAHYATTPLYGWRTTNFVESEQAKSLCLKPRRMQAYELFKFCTTILMSECYSRVQLVAKWVQVGLIVTPRVEGKFQDQLSEAAQYGVTFSSDSVAFFSRINSPQKQRHVDKKQATCSCLTWKQHQNPCRHFIATLIAGGVADTV